MFYRTIKSIIFYICSAVIIISLSHHFVGAAHASQRSLLVPNEDITIKNINQTSTKLSLVSQVPNMKYFAYVSAKEYYHDDTFPKKTLSFIYFLSGMFFLFSVISHTTEYIKLFFSSLNRSIYKFFNASLNQGKSRFTKFIDTVSEGGIS